MRRCKPLKIIPPVVKLNKLVLYLLVYIKRQGYVYTYPRPLFFRLPTTKQRFQHQDDLLQKRQA